MPTIYCLFKKTTNRLDNQISNLAKSGENKSLLKQKSANFHTHKNII